MSCPRLSMTNICSPTYFQIASCTRVAILNSTPCHFIEMGSDSWPRTKMAIFFPAVASDHTFMNYNWARHSAQLAGLVLQHSNSGRGQISLPLKHLIGAHFLTECDKHMRLTRLYDIEITTTCTVACSISVLIPTDSKTCCYSFWKRYTVCIPMFLQSVHTWLIIEREVGLETRIYQCRFKLVTVSLVASTISSKRFGCFLTWILLWYIGCTIPGLEICRTWSCILIANKGTGMQNPHRLVITYIAITEN